MLNIYCIGDAQFLSRVVNGIALICNTHICDALASVGLLVGLIYSSIKGSFLGKGIDIHHTIILLFIYVMMFWPKIDVNLDDLNTNNQYHVDNVPIGVAYPISFISEIGYVLSNRISTAFSHPQMNSVAYASSLTLLGEFRNRLHDARIAIEVTDSIQGDDINNSLNSSNRADVLSLKYLSESWRHYFKECTLTGVNLNMIRPADIFSASSIVKASKFESSIYGTSINVAGVWQNYTCTKAHSELDKLSASYYDELKSYVDNSSSSLNISSGNSNVLSSNSSSFGSEVNDNFIWSKLDGDTGGVVVANTTNLNKALTFLGKSNISMQNYMLNTVLAPLYEEAAISKYHQYHNYSAATALASHIEQQESKWVLSESFFFVYIRPIVTFLEALAFFITPILPLVITLGFAGLTMLVRYVSILLWIQLWRPLLSLINIYILSAASMDLSSLSMPIESLRGMSETLEVVKHYIALGGYLSASVPLIAFFLVSGSSSMLSSLTSGIFTKGGESISSNNLSSISPELSTVGTAINTPSLYNNSDIQGMSKNGAERLTPNVNVRRDLDNAINATREVAASYDKEFSQNLSSMHSKALSNSNTDSTLVSMGERITNGTGKSSVLVRNLVNSLTKGQNLTDSEQKAMATVISMTLSSNLKNLKNLKDMAQLGFGYDKSKSEIVSKIIGNSKIRNSLVGLSVDESLKSEYSKLVSNDMAKNKLDAISTNISDQDSKALIESARRAENYRQKVDRGESLRQGLSGNMQLDTMTLSKYVANNGEAVELLGMYNRTNQQMASRTNELLPIFNSILPNTKQAYVAASLVSLMEQKPIDALDLLHTAIPSVTNMNLKAPSEQLPQAPTGIPPQSLSAQEKSISSFLFTDFDNSSNQSILDKSIANQSIADRPIANRSFVDKRDDNQMPVTSKILKQKNSQTEALEIN